MYLTEEDFDNIYKRIILALNNTANFHTLQTDFSKYFFIPNQNISNKKVLRLL